MRYIKDMTNAAPAAQTIARRAARRREDELAPFRALTDADLVKLWNRSNDAAERRAAFTVISDRVNEARLVPAFTDDCDVQQTIVDTLASA